MAEASNNPTAMRVTMVPNLRIPPIGAGWVFFISYCRSASLPMPRCFEHIVPSYPAHPISRPRSRRAKPTGSMRGNKRKLLMRERCMHAPRILHAAPSRAFQRSSNPPVVAPM